MKVGDNLDGYVVEAVTATAIALVYQPLGHQLSIAIPAEISAGESTPSVAFRPLPAQVQGQGVFTVPGAQPQPGAATPNPALPKPPGGAARVKWDGPAQIKMGANFSLTLRAEANQPISGSAMQLRFDPTVLASVSVQPGKLYAGEVGRGFSHKVNPDGTIFVGATSQASAEAGDSELLVLTFKPLKPSAQVEVSLAALNITGTAGRTLVHDMPASYRATVSR